MDICRSCGFHNPPGMRFCGNCGVRIVKQNAPTLDLPSATQLPEVLDHQNILNQVKDTPESLEQYRKAGLEASGQRRNVTVLFADLTGYTHLASSMDNEDVFELIRKYVQLLINDVHRYEGYVDKLTGDGLMALFGAPNSHENNTERAVRSAIDMQNSLKQLNQQIKHDIGIELQMRIGLHAGSVVVGDIGSSHVMEYTAIGDTVNLAARIQEAAMPGEIWVSASIYQQSYRLFHFTVLPDLSLKGILQPINAYRVDGLVTQPESTRGIEGHSAPLVGREHELSKLLKAVQELLDNKRGRLVMVTGEAGIGKSRLTIELKNQLATQPVRIIQASSLTYRRSISYWLFQDLLRNYFQIHPDDEENNIRDKLVLRLGESASASLPYIEYLLGIKPSDPVNSDRIRFLDAGQLRQQIFLSVRDLLIAEAAERPLLIILEDLHWADEASMELLIFLLELTRLSPIVLYLITRPFQGGSLSKIGEWAEKQSTDNYLPIRMSCLSEAESIHLINNLLSIPDISVSLRSDILKRSAGIPFYLEEILRMLMEKGVLRWEQGKWREQANRNFSELGVPDSLQGLILARFDSLPEFHKNTLQIASVIGHQFHIDLLSRLLPTIDMLQLETVLADLVDKDYITPVLESSNQEYAFRHMLMSEAIYQTLLKRERANLHEKVGEAIEALYAANLDDQVELLARHYSWSKHADQAVQYLILAGRKAAQSFANEQAQQHYQQALILLPQTQYTISQYVEIHHGLADVFILVGDYQQGNEHLQAALTALNGDAGTASPSLRSTLHRKIARTLERQGFYDQALQHLQNALTYLEEADQMDEVEKSQVLNDIGWIFFRQGKFAEAEQLLHDALQLVEDSSALDAKASIYNRLGGIAYNQGDWNKITDYLRKSIAIRESMGDLVGLANSLNSLALLGIERGDFDIALENLIRSKDIKVRLGQSEGVSTSLNNLGWLHVQRGEMQEAWKCLEQALNLARQIGYGALEGAVLKNIGEMHLEAEEWASSVRILLGAVSIFKSLEAQDQLIETYRLLGEATLGAGDVVASKSWADKIQNATASLGEGTRELSSVQRGEYWRYRGMLAARLGEWETANRFLQDSQQIFRTLGVKLYQGKVAMQMGVLAEARGDMYIAQHRYREAELLFRSIGAKLAANRANTAALRQSA